MRPVVTTKKKTADYAEDADKNEKALSPFDIRVIHGLRCRGQRLRNKD